MKLSKSDALFLHSFLFHALTTHHGGDVRVRLEELMEALADFLLSQDEPEEDHDETSDEDDDQEEDESDDEESDDEEDDEDDLQHDLLLTTDALCKLQPASVTSPAGEKVTLQFEDVEVEGAVDALVDDGSLIIADVSSLKVTKKTVELHDGSEWHVFTYKRLPKGWSVLGVDKLVGVE